jgi:hypothetical protein
MRSSNWKLKTVFIFTSLIFAACGGEDEPNETADTGIDEQDTAIADVSDQDTALDNDAGSDAGPDTSEDVGEDTGDAASCSPEEVAAEQVAVNTGVNDGAVAFSADGDVQTASIDASSGGAQAAATASFIYIDLDNAEKLELSDEAAFTNADWDLAFRRTEIRLNSADSGPGSWMVASIDAAWDDAASPGMNANWLQDDFVTDDCDVLTGAGDRGLATAFDGWYAYDMTTHEVSAPEATTWALYSTTTHAVVKFGVDTYADGAYEIRWGSFE